MYLFLALQIYKIFHTKTIAIPLIIKRIAIEFYNQNAIVQEGDVRKTMAARGLVNGRVPTKWEGFSFPNVTLLTPIGLQ